MYVHVTAGAIEARGIRTPSNCRYSRLKAAQCGCLVQNSGPLQEQHLLLIPEPLLQSLDSYFNVPFTVLCSKTSL